MLLVKSNSQIYLFILILIIKRRNNEHREILAFSLIALLLLLFSLSPYQSRIILILNTVDVNIHRIGITFKNIHSNRNTDINKIGNK